MSELHDLIRANEHDDPSDTAAAVLTVMGMSKKNRDILFGLMRDECRRLARAATRIAERAAIESTDRDDSETHGVADRYAYLRKNFCTGDRWVDWGAATVDDHEARIAYLGSYRDGIGTTIRRHQRAVKLILNEGVTCLNEHPNPDLGDDT